MFSALIKNILIFLGASLSVFNLFEEPQANKAKKESKQIEAVAPADTIPASKTKNKKKNQKSVKVETTGYTPKDRYGDPLSNPDSKSPLILKNPANIKTEIELDSSLQEFTIYEKAGDIDYRPPVTMTFDEYSKYKNQQMMRNYFKSKSAGPMGEREDNKKDAFKGLKIPVRGLEGPFGSNFVDIRPNGSVTLDFAGRWQRVNNPQIPVRQQRNGGFDFDQQISMNVTGKIGEKLKLTANWDTKATFDFQNNIKLEYTGFEEDIIQKIEAGFVSMPINSSLISGSQNLFGIKTKLQFGRLSVTSVLSSQKGKVEEVRMQGGSQTRDFEVPAAQYDENRHFFLGHFFRNNYERSLTKLPTVLSGVKVTRVEVYVTNRVNNTTNNMNVVAYMDLGEADVARDFLKIDALENKATTDPKRYPSGYPADSNANKLYREYKINRYRDPTTISTQLKDAIGKNDSSFVEGRDFLVVTSSRKLNPTDFRFNQDLGYISLNSPLTAQDMLAVAFEYTYNGKSYKVGELTGDFPRNDSLNSAIILKLIKPVGNMLNYPTWDLMMKNIYPLGSTQVSRENFQLRILYKDDTSGVDLPNLQDGNLKSIPLLRLFQLDRVGPNLDPPADGNFDFVEDVTIDSKFGRIIFPVLEPFGSGLVKQFNRYDSARADELIDKYVYSELYRIQKSRAINVAVKNKFVLKGRYQSSSSSDIQLPGFNIAPGSVIVMAGPNVLQENLDYTIDYSMGRVKIINEGILQSGQEIRVKYEKQDLFNFRRKTFIGSRFDYLVNKDINLGATVLHQNEAPQLTRVNIGDEPSSNTVIGFDANIKKESRLLTKAVDLLPLIQTKAPSSITFGGEVASLIPGHSKAVDKGEGGTAFIDDFEGARTPIDLTRQPFRWRIGATPIIRTPHYPGGSNEEEYKSNDYNYTSHRGKLAWYTIDNLFYRSDGRKPENINTYDQFNHFVRMIPQQEVFPNRSQQVINVPEPTLDLAYFPKERGPYNFNPEYKNDQYFKPEQSWGAITRDLRNDIDFDNANIQYLEFWMMDPYYAYKNGDTSNSFYKIPINNSTSAGQTYISNNIPSLKGKLVFNLGDISEDIMKDNVHAFENGLPVGDTTNKLKSTLWGKVTKAPYINNSFETSTEARPKQDIGLDGLNNEDERKFFPGFSDLDDPSGDDFNYYLGDNNDQANMSILERYKHFNGVENNSPIVSNNRYTPANYTIPDNEDLNQDNTLNNSERYYEYGIDISPEELKVGKNFIIDETVIAVKDHPNNDKVRWLQFRIPVRQPTDSSGEVGGYNNLRFLRMFLTGFNNPIVLRMVQMQFVASQWRNYEGRLNEFNYGTTKDYSKIKLKISTVNIEENGLGDEESLPYVLPPGYQRDLDITSQNNRQLNEQSLRLCVDDKDGLPDGVAKGAIKYVGYDLLNYGRLRMFIHAESPERSVPDKALTAFVRFGTDAEKNFYEVEIPLHFSRPGDYSPEAIWRSENELNINLRAIAELKAYRTGKFGPSSTYSDYVDGRKVTIVGNPDMSATQIVMIGVRNPLDDGPSYPVCIWANELRATDFIEQAGYAATGNLNIRLADLANITASGRYIGVGFGSLDQKVSQRARVATAEYGVQANIALDKFIPEKAGLRIPFFTSFNKRLILPKYDPLDPDVLLTSSLANRNIANREKYRKLVVDEETRKSYNLTNIQKVKTNPNAKNHFYDVENLNFTIGYSETKRTNYNIFNYTNELYNGGIGYNYSAQTKPIEPFKNIKGMKSPYLRMVKEVNFAFLPSSITFRSDLIRRITTTQYYEGRPTDGFIQKPFYEKSFFFNRNYGLVWALTKSITLNYSALSNSIIDEPEGNPDSTGYNKQLFEKVKQLGRTKNYSHNLNATYRLPFDKLPITDWLSSDVSYAGTYNWVANSRDLQDTLGNAMNNTRDLGLNGRISLDRLYNKVKFLKEANNIKPRPKNLNGQTIKAKLPQVANNKKDSTKTEEPKREFRGMKYLLRTAMSVKSVNFSYKMTEGTRIGGYMGTANIFGLDRAQDPTLMLPFVFGWQDPDVIRRLGANGLISSDVRLQDKFAINKTEAFNAQTSIEPVRDFTIRLTAQQTKSTAYSAFYKDTLDDGNANFGFIGPDRTGTFTSSFIAIGTAFWGKSTESDDPNSSKAFSTFEQNRSVIWRRLGSSNRTNINSQEVLIPAFIAAYSGKDPNQVNLSPTPKIPLPNWNITFTGLTRIEKLKKLFPTISINHAYNSTYLVSGYTSSLYYVDDSTRLNPRTDLGNTPPPNRPDTGYYRPVYVIDQVSIKESFSPLIGITVKTRSRASYTINYLRERMLVLGMANSQLQESQTQGLTIGFGINKTGFKIPFKWQGRKIPPLKNELQFKTDVTVRDSKVIQRNIAGASTVTSGTLNMQIRTAISYMISQRLSMTFYFDRQINMPRISNSFRRAATSFGIQLRFTLS